MLIYCCKDLIFSSSIRTTAKQLNAAARPAVKPQALADRLNEVDDNLGVAPVTGVIVDLELGEDGLALIRQVKAHDDAIPVTAFGSHVAHDMLDAARSAGADFVMPRSMFTANMSDIVSRLAGLTDNA